MYRLWRFSKDIFPLRFLFAMESTTVGKDFKKIGNEGNRDSGEPPHNPPGNPLEPSNTPVEPSNTPADAGVEPANNPPPNPVEPTNTSSADPAKTTNVPLPNSDGSTSTDNPPVDSKESTSKPSDPAEPVNNPPQPDVGAGAHGESRSVWIYLGCTGSKKTKLDFNNMPLEEKRSYYRCGGHYVTLEDVETWHDYAKDSHYLFTKKGWLRRDSEFTPDNHDINSKVSLWLGDITSLEIDAIVNAANRSLLGGGGVDGSIHRAAGKGLLEECRKLNGCETGKAKKTFGYKLPAKHVIHTVGPIGERKKDLKSCYNSCLDLMKDNELRSMAFCCISTGVYGYPNKEAAHVALETVKAWLNENKDWEGRIIFCVFLQNDLDIYQELMLKYFPCTRENVEGKTEDNMPVDSKSKPSDSKSKPSDSKSKTSDSKSKTSDSKSKTSDWKSKTSDSESKPSDSRSKPSDSKSKPSDSMSKTSDSKSKPSDSKSKPSDSKSKTSDSESKPSDSKSKPSDSKPKPNDEELGVADGNKRKRSGRGRGRGGSGPAAHETPKKEPTLLSLVQNKEEKTDTRSVSCKDDDSKERMDTSESEVGGKAEVAEGMSAEKFRSKSTGDDGSHTEESEGKEPSLGSFPREGEDGEEKMDTSESGVGDVDKMAEGTATTVDEKNHSEKAEGKDLGPSLPGEGDGGEENMETLEKDVEDSMEVAEETGTVDAKESKTAMSGGETTESSESFSPEETEKSKKD